MNFRLENNEEIFGRYEVAFTSLVSREIPSKGYHLITNIGLSLANKEMRQMLLLTFNMKAILNLEFRLKS